MHTTIPKGKRWRTRWRMVAGLVGVAVGVSACTGPDGTSTATTTVDHPCTVGVAFDPPRDFDLACAVSLSEDEALHGRLDGTTFYSVTGSALHAIDLVDPQQSWSVSLTDPDQDYLRRPFLLAGTVVVMTGEEYKGDDPSTNYTVNITGISTSTRDVSWERSVPVYSDRWPASIPEMWFSLGATEHDGELLIALGDGVDPLTLLLDPSTGEVRWTSDVTVGATATGQYAIAARGYLDWVILDLLTGQVVRPLVDVSSFGSNHYVGISRYVVDPDGDESHISVLVRGSYASGGAPDESYLQLSSVDASSHLFTPADNDVRYEHDTGCQEEAGQPVLLCQNSTLGLSYGVDRASGQVLWTSERTMTDVALYHGRAYGLLVSSNVANRYAAVDMGTGHTLISYPNIMPIGYVSTARDINRQAPIQVNEFGMVGMVCDQSQRCTADDHVWAPASA